MGLRKGHWQQRFEQLGFMEADIAKSSTFAFVIVVFFSNFYNVWYVACLFPKADVCPIHKTGDEVLQH